MAERTLKPIVLIGSARSGTKILRDALATATRVPAVPYDIGYVWRYGNEAAKDDCLLPEGVTPKATRLVRSFLARYADQRGRVIEKTVGNCLRVEYVAKVLPEASFVHLVRDGVDVVESAQRQWQAPADAGYLLRKMRHFPLRLVPTYGRKFLMSQTLGRRHRGHATTWGPRYRGIDTDVATAPLLTVCARQWRECELAARRSLAQTTNRVVELRYEDLVADPAAVLARVSGDLELDPSPEAAALAAASIRPSHAGSGRALITEEESAILDRELRPLLEELGYARP